MTSHQIDLSNVGTDQVQVADLERVRPLEISITHQQPCSLGEHAAKRSRARALAGLMLLVVALLAVGLVAACFAGCATIPASAVKSLREHVATGRANIRDWDKLTDDQKKHCYWNQVRLDLDTLNAVDGTDLGEFAVSPWDKSAPATADAIKLPSDASK